MFVELPEVDADEDLSEGDAVVAVESVKAASDVYLPVAGAVVEVNEALVDEPSGVNADAEGTGWMVKVKVADNFSVDHLLDEAAYKKVCEEEADH